MAQRLESVFNQTYSNFEVILLDDCSTDNSREILFQYSKNEKVRHCIFNDINSGNTFVQWNKGIELAKGDLIWIAESDDFCDRFFLENLIKPFENDSKVALVYCQSNRVNEFGEITGNWITHTDKLDPTLFLNNFTREGNEFIKQFLIDRNVIPNASAMIFKKAAIKNDCYLTIDPEFRYCGDWMFYFKLIVNHKIAFVAASLNNFRYHGSSVIANALKLENRIRIIDIDFNMRNVLMEFIKQQDISASSYNEIKRRNNNVVRELKYEKALLLIQSSEKVKGYFLLLTVFDVFYKNYNIQKKIRMKIHKLLK